MTMDAMGDVRMEDETVNQPTIVTRETEDMVILDTVITGNDAMTAAALRNNSPSPPRVSGLQPVDTTADTQMEDGTGSSNTSGSVGDSQDSSIPSSSRKSDNVEVLIHKPPAPWLPYASSRTGLVYDARMRFHAELNPSLDDIHPEDPRRIWEIFRELDEADLVAKESIYDLDTNFAHQPFKLWRIPIRQAKASEITLVHTIEHYEWVEALKDKPDEWLAAESLNPTHDSVYFHKLTYYCSLLSCGGAIEACRAVTAGHVKNAIAVIRPPGHHAEDKKPGGFCFFNNVCVAARVCQADFGEKCRKILILDWDVHHGNGVQQAFESDPNVLYISLHVHKNGNFYPKGDYGDHLHVGTGPGIGKNINIPWPCHGMRDGDYLYAFQEVVMPVAQEFDPDLVIISAGFDAAEGDMLGACHISPAGFAHMTHMLMSLAKGKVAVCLEGGYNLRSIAKSALAVTRTLMGEPPDRLVDVEPSKPGIDTVQLVKRIHSKYWRCLYPRDIYQDRLQVGGERLHDVLRQGQMFEYFRKYDMINLHVQRDRISKSFDNQVLATRHWESTKPLLVIFHDPPETEGIGNPITNRLEPHNIIVTDVVKSYVEWAVNNDFSVIDVNIPEHITDVEDTQGYVAGESNEVRAQMSRELAMYLWENYIEMSDATQLFFIGVGAAYSTLVWLLGQEERCQNKTELMISFVGLSPLVGIQRAADDYIAAWFWDHSKIFVASDHYFWSPERSRKLRKKYGDLEQSKYSDLSSMMNHHRAEVFTLLSDLTEDWRLQESQRKAAEEAAASKTESRIVPTSPHAGALNGTGGSGSGNNRSGTSGSPRPTGLSSPVKFPPRGIFGVTSPERTGNGNGGGRSSVSASPVLR